jgi:FK506-binding protein 1
MGVEKTILEQGSGADVPKKNDKIAMQYTGWLYDANKADNDFKGEQYDY